MMKNLRTYIWITLLLCCVNSFAVVLPLTPELEDVAVEEMAKTIQNTNLAVIAVCAVSKDMHLRMGYESDKHVQEAIFEMMRILPTCVLQTVYAPAPLDSWLFVHDAGIYIHPDTLWTLVEWHIPAPFTRLYPYPSEPIAVLLFLGPVDITKTGLNIRNYNDKFAIHTQKKMAEDAPLSEIMSFVGMENLVTTNRVWKLLDTSILTIDIPTPPLPPIPIGEELFLSPYDITDLASTNLYPLPAAFADDLSVIVPAYKSLTPGETSSLEVSTSLGRKLANRLMPGSAPEPEEIEDP